MNKGIRQNHLYQTGNNNTDSTGQTHPLFGSKILIKTRAPLRQVSQDANVPTVLDSPIPCFRSKTTALYLRSMPQDGNKGFEDIRRPGRRRDLKIDL